jgi:tRNA 2-selenouridine synthase
MIQTIASPIDLDVQNFNEYSIIIDARSPKEFARDHLPGAINLPVVDNDEYAEVGTTHKTNKHRAYLIGVAYSLRNMADSIEGVISTLPVNSPILVYCFRGGKRSRLWGDTLRTIGYQAKVLPGGWKNYRRWIVSCLDSVPAAFNYHVLAGPTGCGKTRLLHALEAQGEQVIDLEAIAEHRGSLIGSIPGTSQPTQMTFDTRLIDYMRQLDPTRPVWVEAESKKIGNIQLPTALITKMHASPFVKLHAAMPERVKLWHEDYGHFEADPKAFMAKLEPLRPLLGHAEIDAWHELANAKQFSELFERIMVKHYDPAYNRSSGRNYGTYANALDFTLAGLNPAALELAATDLIAHFATTTATATATTQSNPSADVEASPGP